ncbi:MAG: UDP-4-amino-4,6-dideoxy-N-acetyl-beta-L-altrosamine transaminase [Elusimicrobia bacterium GWD2_63_28]|nr:MAG: UDP-4-amino-4,6-dideoxy-N-acetyl-beta-L-altrosamine transaminase [Elusimicrobia bacterium GWD2_63_28]
MRKPIPYGSQWIDDEDVKAVAKVLKGELITQGPVAVQFEEKICELTGAKYCLSMANGTAALHLAVMALELEKGMEGITSTNTFVASSNAFVYSGLKPVLADIDPRTFNVFPEDLKKRITKKTRVIIPVHFAGQPCETAKIRKLAGKQVHIIEDAAHAIGSKYEDGSLVGACKHSDMTIFSFHPVKTITSGEGGAITTNSKVLYERLKSMRICGVVRDVPNKPGPWYYEVQRLGFNYRLTDIHCALGMSQLGKLKAFIKRRREIVARYNKELAGLPVLTLPYERPGVFSAFHLYVTLIDFKKLGKSRKEVIETLVAEKIGTQVHYIPVHEQPYYRKEFGYKHGDLPNSEKYYEQALSLPLYPRMTDEEVDHVIKQVRRVLS